MTIGKDKPLYDLLIFILASTNKADYTTQGKIMAFARSVILDIFEEEVTPCHVWKKNGKITQIMVQQAIL